MRHRQTSDNAYRPPFLCVRGPCQRRISRDHSPNAGPFRYPYHKDLCKSHRQIHCRTDGWTRRQVRISEINLLSESPRP